MRKLNCSISYTEYYEMDDSVLEMWEKFFKLEKQDETIQNKREKQKADLMAKIKS